MDFSVLGPLTLVQDGASVSLDAPKQRALLILLLLHAGRTVPVDRLLDALWRGDPPPRARVTVRSYISYIRRVLETPGDERAVIVTRGNGYALDVDPDRVDAVRFQRLVQEGRQAAAAARHEHAVGLLDEALRLWRGQAYADVGYEDFAQAEIARLDELRSVAQEERFDALLAMGRHTGVIADLEAFVAEHPLRERARGQLMLGLYRSGRSADALETFAALRTVLREQRGLDPGPDLQALAERILKQADDLEVPVATPAPAVREHLRARPGSGARALVGREGERARLRAVAARLTAGAGELLLISGEPGIGKTALLRGLADLCSDAGADVQWGRCRATEGAPAFWPWIQLVRGLAASRSDDELRSLLAGVAAPVTQLVPELGDRIGGATGVTGDDPETARFKLYEAVTTFLLRCGSTRPLALLLDDVHWAEPASHELLAFVTPQLPASGLLIAAAYRDIAAERTVELEATLGTIAREEDGVEQISLTGLGREHVGELVLSVAGRQVPEAVVGLVYDRTSGNPFFVRQLARLIDETGVPGDEGASARAIPAGVRQVIALRLQQLPPPARRLLETAAVAGRYFDLRVTAKAIGMAFDEALDAVDAARAHGLVEAFEQPVTSYRFVHALLQETIYDGLTPARAARLHEAVGQELARSRRAMASQVAEHFWRAADLLDDDRAVGHLLAAADEASAVLAYEQAEDYLQRALALVTERGREDPAAELAVLLRLMRAVIFAQGWSASAVVEVVTRARELTETVGLDPELVPLWQSLWQYSLGQADFETGLALGRRLLAEGQRTGDAFAIASGRFALGFACLNQGDPQASAAHLEAGVVQAQGIRPDQLARMPENLAVALRAVLGAAKAASGHVAESLQHSQYAIDLARTTGAPFPQAYAHMLATYAAVALDDHGVVARRAAAGLDLCARHGFDHVGRVLTVLDAWAAAHLGDDPAREADRLNDALDGIRRSGQRIYIAEWLTLLAEVHLLAGNRKEARARLQEARHTAQETHLRRPERLVTVEQRLGAVSQPQP